MEGLKASLTSILRERTLPSLRRLWHDRTPLLWGLAVLVGIAGGYGILGLRWAIGEVQWLWLGHTGQNVVATVASFRAPLVVFLGPVIGGLVVGVLLHYLTPLRRAHSIADVIEARALHKGKISWRAGLSSAVISAISLGSGASAGREGPAVHLGAALASLLGSRFSLGAPSRRILLGCGAAAAVSASFNAPIAGVLFALEVVIGHYALSAFVPTVIASVVSTLITRFYLGDFPAFIFPEYHIASYLEFPAFALLGLVCGLVAVAFHATAMAADWGARQISMPLWVRPVAGGAIIGIIALAVPEILGVGYEATNLALREKYALGTLFVLLFAKTVATAITLASRFGGGVFSPSLYLGAMAGGAFGIIAAGAFPDYASSYGVYAILGMGAVAGAILGAPISTTLIVFELTGGYEMTIALLLSVSIASMVMQALLGHSYFTWQLSQRGIHLSDGPHRQIMRTLTVSDFLTPLSDEERADPPELFEDRPRLSTSDTLETALRAFATGDFTRIAVLSTGENPRHIGWADHPRALAAYNSALVEASVEEHR